MKKNRTFYDILGISKKATLKEIKDAYRKKAMEWHPDNNKNIDETKCHTMMCLINQAYETLRNPESRKIYDEGILFESQEESVDSEPSTTKIKYPKSHSGKESYEYYNSVDYDDDMQKQFVEWIIDFSENYIDLVLRYVFSRELNSYNVLDILYETFGSIIDYEQISIKSAVYKLF